MTTADKVQPERVQVNGKARAWKRVCVRCFLKAPRGTYALGELWPDLRECEAAGHEPAPRGRPAG